MFFPWEPKMLGDLDQLKSFSGSLKAFCGADFSKR
jgi:hypothetical protein